MVFQLINSTDRTHVSSVSHTNLSVSPDWFVGLKSHCIFNFDDECKIGHSKSGHNKILNYSGRNY